MSTLSTTHLRDLLNLLNSIIDQRDPLGIFQGQIEQIERNFTTPHQPLYLYIDLPKEDPQTSFIKSTFTLASPTPLNPPGLRLKVDCPCIDLGSSGVVLPRGVEFSTSTSSTPPTRRVTLPAQAKDCKRMDEKECTNNPDICIYRRIKGGRWMCTARPGALKSSALRLRQGLLNEIKPPLRQGLLTLFKPRVWEYLPDLIGTTSDDTTHVLPHDHTHFNNYRHIEVVKRFTITEYTMFYRSLMSIIGGPVNLVGDMIYKFWNLTLFNSPVDRWDVSQVTHMSQMFHGAITFNQPLGQWNVSRVTDMESTFQDATTFNQPLEQWNVSGITDMSRMFEGATAFNQPLGGWDTSGVTSMSFMFTDATAFNQPLGQWNVSRVTEMDSMFQDAITFNQPLGGWNVSGGTNHDDMFDGSGMDSIPSWYSL